MTGRVHGRLRLAAAGTAIGLAAAGVVLGFAGIPGAGARPRAADEPFLEVGHLAPKLRAPGEPAQLRFELRCVPPDGDVEASLSDCNAAGTVYVRAGAAGSFTAVPLQRDPAAVEDPYYANVPASIAGSASGFQYYAVLRDVAHGLTRTFPAGGASAPLRSLPLGPSAVTVDLGTHVFGSTQSPNARVASASWGSGPGQVGLEPGADTPVGATSFDVRPAADGVFVLDEANRRVLRFAGSNVTAIALAGLDGVPADLTVGGDGKLYVLEEPAASRPAPRLTSFSATGTPLAQASLAETIAPRVRLNGSTAYVQAYPSSQWVPAIDGTGTHALGISDQVTGAVVGRPGANGTQTVVQATDAELRVAFVTSTGWNAVRVRSATSIGDVQVAERTPGGNTVLVFSLYTDTQHEYEVIVVSPQGAVLRQFAVPAAEYSDVAAASFRLAGSSLYALASTPGGITVDRYDLGVS